MKAFPAAALVLVSAGCFSPPVTLYDWGDYEESLYRVYREGAPIEDEIRILAEEVRQTQEAGKNIPPGRLAHLGYLCGLAGDRTRAADFFRLEKELYPESGKFMGFLIEKMPCGSPE